MRSYLPNNSCFLSECCKALLAIQILRKTKNITTNQIKKRKYSITYQIWVTEFGNYSFLTMALKEAHFWPFKYHWTVNLSILSKIAYKKVKIIIRKGFRRRTPGP